MTTRTVYITGFLNGLHMKLVFQGRGDNCREHFMLESGRDEVSLASNEERSRITKGISASFVYLLSAHVNAFR